MIQRWQLKDLQTGSIFNFPNNPNKMTSPNKAKVINSIPTASGANAIERNADPKEWTFEGVIRSSGDYANYVAAFKSTNRQQLTDHLGRVYIVRVKSYKIVERLPSRQYPWRFTYTVTAHTYYRQS